MRVFVTGANGYLGGHLALQLEAAGHNVNGVNSHGDTVWGPQSAWAYLGSADAVVHLGWYSVAGDEHPAAQSFSLEATRALLGMVKRECPPRTSFIFASTASVYGPMSPSEAPVSEAATPVPNCAYTHAKVAAEKLVRQNGRHVILRLGSLMGRGAEGGRTKNGVVVNACAIAGYASRRVRVWQVDNLKPLLHVRDAARILALAATDAPGSRPNAFWGGTINACAFHETTQAIAQAVCSAVEGAQLEVVADPAGAASPRRSCRMDCARLHRLLPLGFVFRTLGEAIREFATYKASPADVQRAWASPSAGLG